MAITLTPTLTPATGTQSAPIDVVFDVTVAGATAPVTYFWSFGDGLGATTKNGAHTYAKGRSYTVSLHVMDADAQVASWSTTYVVNPELVAGFTHTVTIGGGGSNSVAAANTTTGGTGPYTYLWEWGDGSIDTGATPADHTYAEAGSYTLKLTVTDDQGHVSSASQIVIVPGVIIVAVNAVVPPISSVPVTIDFTAAASQGTGPYTYTWKFGDGATATGASVSHTFTTPGIFEVSVAVVDALGHDAGGRVDVEVLEFLTSDPDRIPEKGLPVLPVTFYANTVGGKKPYAYLWDFQDGSTSTEQNPKHNFERIGYYNVTVQVTDYQGSSHTMVCAVDVGGAPGAVFSITIYYNIVSIYGQPFTVYNT